jgi:hypothetical protein
MVPAIAPDGTNAEQTTLTGTDLPPGVSAPAPAAARGTHEAVAVPNGPPIEVAHDQSASQPILVKVLRYEPKMRVSVLGTSGEELEGANVQPGDTVVSLSSPDELGTKHPAIVATYEDGSSQETIVKSIHVIGSL